MDENGFMELIMTAMDLMINRDIEDQEEPRIEYYRSFEQAMLLTMNVGIVVTTREGDEFQMRIVQSKFADK